jgi:hypothetical protein
MAISLIGCLIIENIKAIKVVIIRIGKCNSYFVQSANISNVSHQLIANRTTNSQIFQYGKNMYVRTNIIHIITSIIRYRLLNLVQQFLHFHFCTKKLMSGINSVADNVFQHLSHFERPNRIDLIHWLSRFLPINTHQNDPKIVQSTKNKQIFSVIIMIFSKFQSVCSLYFIV